jgi:hypothetical protein
MRKLDERWNQNGASNRPLSRRHRNLCSHFQRLRRRLQAGLLSRWGISASLAITTAWLSAPTDGLGAAIEYSTFLGGSGDESSARVALDAEGNVYVTGTTSSTEFPGTPPVDRSLGDELDAFVMKFSPQGALIYSTLVGGPCDDEGNAIAVDQAGNAYITGRSDLCIWGGFTSGVLVAKIGPTGDLIYQYVFGAPLADSSRGLGIAVDPDGNAYVTGIASGAGFPVTANAFQQTNCGGYLGDGFVAKINPQGNDLGYCTYLCGTGHDSANAIALDAQRNVIIVGRTASQDFPTTNAFQSMHRGGPAGETSFVSKLDSTGSHLIYSTYLGGTFGDVAAGVAVDAAGNAYVTGETAGGDFPTTPGVVQAAAPYPLCFGAGICSDAFVAKFSPTGSLLYSTLLGGEGDDAGNGIAVDAAGNAYIVGSTASLYFPILRAFQSKNHGIADAFITELNSNATRILFSSYLGGGRPTNSPSLTEGGERGSGIALAPGGKVYLSGRTVSFDFPTTPGAYQTNAALGWCLLELEPCGNAFLTRITLDGPTLLPTPHLQVGPSEAAPGETVTATWGGLASPTSDDVLVLYGLGEQTDGFIFLPTFSTGGTAAGTLPVLLPETLTPGSYELRWLTLDPEAAPLLKTVARSEPVAVLGPLTLIPAVEASGTLVVRVLGLKAGSYRIEAADNLHSPTWQLLTNAVAEAGGIGQFRERIDPARSQRFYRASQ